MKRFLISLLASIALPTAVNANDAEYWFTYCINKKIEQAGNSNDYVDARELQRFCACTANNTKQNLNIYSCPDYSVIPKYEIDRFFNP